MTKRAIIIHCWEGYPEYCWYPHTKKELEKLGFAVEVPVMPDTKTPHVTSWLAKLQETTGRPDENLYLIGHSLGCITILRYLESLQKGEIIGGVVLVAGFTGDIGYEQISSFLEKPVDFKLIKSRVKNGFVAIHSDNDKYVGLKHGDTFKKELGAEVIIKHNANHFAGSDVYEEGDCLELPDVVGAVIKLSNR